MSKILLIIDGAADKGYPELGGLSPLEYAKTPNLDRLAKNSRFLCAQTIPNGLPPGTDTALLTLLGANAQNVGRAYLEAAGMGIEIKENERAVRINLACIEDYLIASHCGDGVSQQEADELMDCLLQDEEIADELFKRQMRLIKGKGFRHIMTYIGEEIETFAPHEIVKKPYYDYLPPKWAKLLIKMAIKLEECSVNSKRSEKGQLKVNMLLPWGQGEKVKVPNFESAFGARGAIVCAAPIVKGIGRLAGLYAPEIEGANGELDTDYREKVRVALALKKDYDIVIVHLEAPDEMSHRGDIFSKVKAIAIADEMAGEISQSISEFMIMTDHYTYCDTRKHGDMPVPCMIYGKGQGDRFIEREAEKGEKIKGEELIKVFLKENL